MTGRRCHRPVNCVAVCPLSPDGLGDQLCERILSVLFELWALACSRFFPSPPMWKTFREMCCNWRHQPPLVAQWHRFNLTFTARMLRLMYGQDYPQLQVCEYLIYTPASLCVSFVPLQVCVCLIYTYKSVSLIYTSTSL